MKTILPLLFFLLPVVSFPQVKDRVLNVGKRDSVYSKVLTENRHYWVYLPSSYNDKSIQPIRYPVLYILDGNIHFHSITGMTDILSSGVNGTHVIPEMIVISILNVDRTRDMTPTATKKGFDGVDTDWLATSGGGDRFLRFVEEELIQKVEKDYRTYPYRIFVGHSFGGLAAINAMISRPQLFNGYVLIDPSVWWDNKIMLKRTTDWLPSADLKGKSIFIGQANSFLADDPRGNMPFEAIKEFNSLLEEHSTRGLRLRYKYYEHDNHGSVALAAEYDALRFIFEDYYAPFDKIRNAAELKAHYRDFSEKVGVNFNPPEKVVNELAGLAMYFKRYDIVHDYYQMNIELYPKSRGAYSRMADLWSTRGNAQKAIEYYEKCLQVDPTYLKAKDKIKQLTVISK